MTWKKLLKLVGLFLILWGLYFIISGVSTLIFVVGQIEQGFIENLGALESGVEVLMGLVLGAIGLTMLRGNLKLDRP